MSRILTVSRAVVEVPPDEHPTGGRFLVKDYPKDKEYRRFKLSAQITAKIMVHIEASGLGPMICCSATRPRTCPRSGAACPTSLARDDRPGREGPPVPARHPDGLQRRQMPV